MKKAVIYTRVSTLNQDFERQVKELNDYASYKNFEVVKEFSEKVSGATKTESRDKFNSLLEFLDNNPDVKTLLVWELSRIGRNMANTIFTVNALSERGVNTIILKDNIQTLTEKGEKNPSAELFLGMLSGFASYELSTTKQRIISGLRQSKLNGGANGATQPYGYKSIKRKLAIDETESEIVKQIFEKYISGLGTVSIAKWLNNSKIPTRLNIRGEKAIKTRFGRVMKANEFSWSDKTIYAVLKNPIYIGKRRLKQLGTTRKEKKFETIESENLRIISDELFQQTETILKNKNNKQGINTKYENPLNGIIYCGNCGLRYFQHKRKDNSDNAFKCMSKRYYYKDEFNNCKNPSVNIDRLNDAIYSILLRTKPRFIKKASESKLLQLNNSLSVKEIEVNNAKEEITQAQNHINELIDMKLNNRITGELYDKRYFDLGRQIDTNQTNLNSKQTELLNIKQQIKEIERNKNTTLTRENYKEYIKHFVKRITIHDITNHWFENEFINDNAVKVRVCIELNFIEMNIMLVRNNNKYFFELSPTSYNLVKAIEFEKD